MNCSKAVEYEYDGLVALLTQFFRKWAEKVEAEHVSATGLLHDYVCSHVIFL